VVGERERGPAPVRVRHDDGERIMRDGLMLSCAGLAEEPASAVVAESDCLPPAFVDCLLDSALEPVLDAAVQRGGRAAKRKKNAGDATEVARALLAGDGLRPGLRLGEPSGRGGP